MPGIDAFAADGFSMEELTAAVNRMDYLPQRLLQLGVFEPRSISTTVATIERRHGVLKLVQSSPRGGDGDTRERNKREVIHIDVPHLQINDRIYADEVQDVRAFGSQSALQGVQQLVQERLTSHRRDLEFTLENHRMGAIEGVVLDADGSTLLDIRSEFGQASVSKVQLDLANKTGGALRTFIQANVIRPIARALKMGGMRLEIRAFCGADFYDALVENAEFRASYLQQQEATELRKGTAFTATDFAGVLWEELRGSDLSTPTAKTSRVTADECIFVPVVPGLFQQVFAPADYNETVNTPGLPFYAKQAPDTRFQKYTDLEVQSNSICFCTIPEVLLKGDKDA